MSFKQAMADDRPFARFDYTGHGESARKFEDTTLEDWLEDTLRVVDELTTGDVIMVGSSTGGWMSLLAGMRKPDRIKGLVLVAPAPDFTEKLWWEKEFTPEIREEINTKGYWMCPSPYDDDYPVTKELIEAGRRLCILDDKIELRGMPVRILQGLLDDAVPWGYAQQLVEKITSEDVQFNLIKDADHRLSRPQDIDLLISTVLDLADNIDATSQLEE